jgi:biopolymer transport protein ExbB
MTNALFTLLTRGGAGWVLLLLVGLSALSLVLVAERFLFFRRNGRPASPELRLLLAAGRLEEARLLLGNRGGLEAQVAREALAVADGGPGAVDQAVACAVASARPAYERGLSALGTLGTNAPFLGLFGTVIGIIQAFAQLAVGTAKGQTAAAVMGGISEALVATAVGILVAIPAVVAFNGYQRWLRLIVGRAEAIGHALRTHLERDDVREPALARARAGRAA